MNLRGFKKADPSGSANLAQNYLFSFSSRAFATRSGTKDERSPFQ